MKIEDTEIEIVLIIMWWSLLIFVFDEMFKKVGYNQFRFWINNKIWILFFIGGMVLKIEQDRLVQPGIRTNLIQ